VTRRVFRPLKIDLKRGDRVVHKFFRTRGTVLAIGEKRMLIEFDNGDRQQLGSGGVRALSAKDLHPEERFTIGERVQHWQTGQFGRVELQNGDRVVMIPDDGGRREIAHARHLFHVK